MTATVLDRPIVWPHPYWSIRYVAVGQVWVLRLPHSEVCMHLRVAGKPMLARVEEHGVQLLELDTGRRFSMPITHGEAGFYTDSVGRYVTRDQLYADDPAIAVVPDGRGGLYDVCFTWEAAQSYALNEGRKVVAVAPDRGVTVEQLQSICDADLAAHDDCFGPRHVGHFSRLGGTWWCDTCDSPYCEEA